MEARPVLYIAGRQGCIGIPNPGFKELKVAAVGGCGGYRCGLEALSGIGSRHPGGRWRQTPCRAGPSGGCGWEESGVLAPHAADRAQIVPGSQEQDAAEPANSPARPAPQAELEFAV